MLTAAGDTGNESVSAAGRESGRRTARGEADGVGSSQGRGRWAAVVTRVTGFFRGGGSGQGRAPGRGQRERPPVTVRSGAQDTELSLDRSGLAVRIAWARVGGGYRWEVRARMRWEEVALLDFGYGSHDTVVSLYAVPRGGRRLHLVDARVFTAAQWKELVAGVEAHSGGRLTIDLSRRDRPGPLGDS